MKHSLQDRYKKTGAMVRIVLYCAFTIVALILADLFVSRLYCSLERNYDCRQWEKGNERQAPTESAAKKQSGIKKLAKWARNLYSGWIRLKLYRLGRTPCHMLRILLLKHVYLMKLSKRVVIYGGFEIRAPWNITIDEGTIIGDNAILDGRNGITIGKNVNFSTGVWIWTEQHDYNDPLFSTNHKGGPVIIGDRAWLSARTQVLPKVTIGEGAVIAAGGLVTRDCEPFSIYGGIPCKKIGERNRNLHYMFDGSHIPFY